MNDIANNIQSIRARINAACAKAGRKPEEVKLLLATKTVSAERIMQAISCGETLIAENKVQELKDKYEAIKNTAHQSHFIGHLQTNKIKEILKYKVSCLQSLDRIELAEKLNERLAFENKTMNVLIQVNTSNEKSKFGVDPGAAIDLIKQVSQLKNIHVNGLMTIGLFSTETEKVSACFRLLKNLQQCVIKENIPGVSMEELSMGMSGDMEAAIEQGATIIRIGTAIFGQRMLPDSYYWNENKS